MRAGGAPIDTLTVPSAACISAVMHVACCMPHGCMFLATCTWHLWQVVSVPITVLHVECLLSVPLTVPRGCRMRRRSRVTLPCWSQDSSARKYVRTQIDSSTHSAAVASQNRHAAVCAACIATDSLCAHNRTAPHRTARRCTARRCTAGYRGRVVLSTQRSDRTRVRWQFQWRRHSQSRVRVADRLGTARALHCAALHCSLNSPQCKLTSASLTCGTATLGVGTSRHSSGTPTAKPPSTCRRQSHSAGKSVIRQ
jgi:hypothetical protein